MGENEQTSRGALLSVVIPAFNEARRLPATLESIRRFAGSRPVEVIVVDDGSTDGTAAVVRDFPAAPLELRLLIEATNHGKGHSVRRGVLESRGQNVLMCDADGSTPIDQVDRLLPWLEKGYDVVIGSREVAGAVLDPPQRGLRRTMARAFQGLRRRLMLPELYDTQCGFKLFRGEAARQLFAKQQEDGFAFDVEVLLLAEAMGLKIREIGVVWRNDAQSTVRPLRDSLHVVRGLLRIRRRLRQFEKEGEGRGGGV